MQFPLTDEMCEFFKNKKKSHLILVNEFAHKYDSRLSFPNHDLDKFEDPQLSLLAPHIWYEFHPNFKWSKEWDILEKQGKDIHKTVNQHHPEYWKDISKMTEIAMIEMCCDWCAVNVEDRPRNGFYGSGFEGVFGFYKDFAIPKYKFTIKQKNFLESVLSKLVKDK